MLRLRSKMHRVGISLLLIFLVWSANAHAIEKASLLAPLVVDGVQYNSAWLYTSEDPQAFFVEAGPLLEVLSVFLPNEEIEKICSLQNDKYLLSLSALAEQKIEAHFDERTLDLVLKIPNRLRKEYSVDISGTQVRRENNFARSDSYSGYLNVRGSDSYISPHQGSARNFQPFLGNLNLVNNLSGLVFETGTDYTQQSTSPWRRNDTKAIYDWESKMVRVSAGDIAFPFSGYQNSIPMGGISVTREFSIQPYALTRPLNATNLFLNRASDLELYVNGVFRTKLHLPAGPVDIKNFSLSNGLNRVELRITDDLGQTQVIEIPMLYDPLLLGKGIHQFAYASGAPSSPTLRDRNYDFKNITNSLFHRVGVLDNLTMGLNFQENRNHRLLGFEDVWVMPLGLLSSDIARNWSVYGLPAWAGIMRYRSPEYWNGSRRRTQLGLSAEYKDYRFAGLSEAIAANNNSWNGGADLTHYIDRWQASMNLGFQENFSRFPAMQENSKTWKVNLTKNWSTSWRTSLDYQHSSGFNAQNSIYLALSYTESAGRYYGNLSYNSIDHTERLDIQRNPSTQVDDVRLSASLQKSNQEKDGDIQAQYIGQRSLLQLEQQYSNHASVFNQTKLSFGTAFAWTKSSFALSRPINDSFVVFPQSAALRKFSIGINRNGKYPEANSSTWGPAILPGVSSYTAVPVVIDGSTLPFGYSIGKEYWTALASYKSGITIPIQGDATLIVQGALVHKNKKPIALAVGELYSSSNILVGNFFTNRKGEFQIENLKADRYELRFYDRNLKPISIRLEDGVGLVRLAEPMIVEQDE